MAGDTDERRTDTRQQIRAVALELFARQGYEQTSLREIAERLGVTKAALYYHYRTKQEILSSLLDEQLEELDALLEWGRATPAGPHRARGVLERYNAMLTSTIDKAPQLIRFIQDNETPIRELAAGARVREQFQEVVDLLVEPDAGIERRLRAQLAVIALHLGARAADPATGDPAGTTGAALRVALELGVDPAADPAGDRTMGIP